MNEYDIIRARVESGNSYSEGLLLATTVISVMVRIANFPGVLWHNLGDGMLGLLSVS